MWKNLMTQLMALRPDLVPTPLPQELAWTTMCSWDRIKPCWLPTTAWSSITFLELEEVPDIVRTSIIEQLGEYPGEEVLVAHSTFGLEGQLLTLSHMDESTLAQTRAAIGDYLMTPGSHLPGLARGSWLSLPRCSSVSPTRCKHWQGWCRWSSPSSLSLLNKCLLPHSRFSWCSSLRFMMLPWSTNCLRL